MPQRTENTLVNGRDFASCLHLGSVVTWGDSDFGGDSSAIASQLRKGVRIVCGSYGAFAAVKAGGNLFHARLNGCERSFLTLPEEDGSVITWGHPDFGGSSSDVAAHLTGGVVLRLGTHVR